MEAALSDNESVSIDPLNQIDLVAASRAAPSVAPSNGLQPSQMSRDRALLRAAARRASRYIIHRNIGIGSGSFRNAEHWPHMVLSGGRWDRRHLHSQPVRELQYRRICRTACLRRQPPRATYDPAIPGT